MIELKLIGCMHAVVHSELRDIGFGGASKSLAAFLFLQLNKPQRRGKLADMFWPELDEMKASAALNSAVWRIKKLLFKRWNLPDSAVHSTSNYVVIKSEKFFTVDVHLLREIIDYVIKTDVGTISDLDRVIDMIMAYEDELLEGESDLWVLNERERLNSDLIQAGMKVVKHCGVDGEIDQGIAICRKLLWIDPYREKIVRYLLVLLAASDNREEAIRLFHNWRSKIKAELDINPLDATMATAESVRNISTVEQAQILAQKTLGQS